MVTITLEDSDAEALLVILRSLHMRPTLLDTLEAMMPSQAVVDAVEDAVPTDANSKKSKAKAAPVTDAPSE